jgi:hypothetical protein
MQHVLEACAAIASGSDSANPALKKSEGILTPNNAAIPQETAGEQDDSGPNPAIQRAKST